jgi:hypothetical protein
VKTFPRIFKIQQLFKAPRLDRIEEKIDDLLNGFQLSKKIKRGDRVALTAGSRGIMDQARIFKIVISRLKEQGARPLVVPCMGSHGGATADGQRTVLRDLGITEETIGSPIISSMDVQEVGRSRYGAPVLIGKNLCGVDKIIVINRIKPHTHFQGTIEGGLTKMLVIGMGKHQGAQLAHRLAVRKGLLPVLLETASVVLKKLPIFFGLGIIENQYAETAFVDLIEPKSWIEKEKLLLKKARRLVPSLPFSQIDLLVVDEIGKNISGAGMDTKVIGRVPVSSKIKFMKPEITQIFVRDLSNATHGNATGIGLADFTTQRLVDKVDYQATHINCMTAICPGDAKIPIFFKTDREALQRACLATGVLDPEDLRIVWIKNTSELEYLFVSSTFFQEVNTNPRLKRVSGLFSIPFDRKGNLASP